MHMPLKRRTITPHKRSKSYSSKSNNCFRKSLRISMADSRVKTHIAILPTPGMGHLIPLSEFAKRLLIHHNISSTFIIPSDGPLSAAHKSFISALPHPINHVLLPPVDFSDMPKDTKIETQISLTITRSQPSIVEAVKSLHESKNLAALVVDLFGTDVFDVAMEFKIPKYIFFPTNALILSLILQLPELHQTVQCEYRDMQDKIELPGCIPIHGRDLFDPVQDRTNEAYKWIIHHAKRYRMADGILINTFKELEPGAIEALEAKQDGRPTVRAIGPLVQMESKSVSSDCLDWLDAQPSSSVVFISFGSGGTLSHDQIIELALGLEISEQRFLWVLRCPNDKSANATFFSIQNSGDPLAYLPHRFLEKTSGRGLVVPMWAPQAQILAHESTGVFVSHCGWNSTLESVVYGVPLIGWPLYAEQKMNAIMLHEDVRAALRIKVGESGLVGRVEVANVVKGLMEGEEGKRIRSRMRDLKEAAAKDLGDDGSSTKALAEFANKWKGEATN